jgi:hypothetical protein
MYGTRVRVTHNNTSVTVNKSLKTEAAQILEFKLNFNTTSISLWDLQIWLAQVPTVWQLYPR